MNSELFLKVDYNIGRKDPAEIFEAMGLYINAQRDFCQLLANAIDVRVDFDFQLNAVVEGSVLTKVSAYCQHMCDRVEQAFYNSGQNLFETLVDVSVTETEEQVDGIAVVIEEGLSDMVQGGLVRPDIDRQALAYVLEKLSEANKKMQSGEVISMRAGNDSGYTKLNKNWRFTGDPKDMFLGGTVKFEGRDKLYPMIQVNKGKSAWTFKSPATGRKFSAKIVDKDWLQRYQQGFIEAIGPLDIVEADLSYDVYTPPAGKGNVEIKDAKIKKIFNVIRNGEHQNALAI